MAAKPSDQQKACQGLSQLSTDANNIEQMIGPQATVGQLKQATKDMDGHFKTFLKSSGKVAGPQTDNLKTSLDNLRSNITNVPDTMTLEQVKSNIKDSVDQVQSATNQLNTTLNCGVAPPALPPAPATP
jgi:DNA anti-recombination protein RmuC